MYYFVDQKRQQKLSIVRLFQNDFYRLKIFKKWSTYNSDITQYSGHINKSTHVFKTSRIYSVV